jgi:hypothetical protein
VTLDLDGTGEASIDTGIGFLDHMLHALAKHARFNLELKCNGVSQRTIVVSTCSGRRPCSPRHRRLDRVPPPDSLLLPSVCTVHPSLCRPDSGPVPRPPTA